jgi:hypothetical protein
MIARAMDGSSQLSLWQSTRHACGRFWRKLPDDVRAVANSGR